ncbi:MAG: hypothetical protein KA479_05575 [Saprospiraceae bacterium]|nr:hypothetical protein [Saprospiraceae bacterium]
MFRNVTIFFGLLFNLWALKPDAQNMALYVSDAGNFDQPPWQILKFDVEGKNGEVFIDHHLAWPQDILFLEHEGIVLISNLNTGQIIKFDSETGAYIGVFAHVAGGPTRMKLGKDSLLYVLQWAGNGRVLRYNLNGTLADVFTSVGVQASIGMDWDVDGNLYVSSYSGKYIRKFDQTGKDLGLFANFGLLGPTNIWFTPSGQLMVMDFEGGVVQLYHYDGLYLGIAISNILNGEGVAFLPNGNMLLGSGGASSVREYTADGMYLKDFITPGALGLMTPNAVVLRTLKSTSTETLTSYDLNLFYPTTGNIFRTVNPALCNEISQIQVYHSSGSLACTIALDKDMMTWDASHFAPGAYYIVAQKKDGRRCRQQIIVQH